MAHPGFDVPFRFELNNFEGIRNIFRDLEAKRRGFAGVTAITTSILFIYTIFNGLTLLPGGQRNEGLRSDAVRLTTFAVDRGEPTKLVDAERTEFSKPKRIPIATLPEVSPPTASRVANLTDKKIGNTVQFEPTKIGNLQVFADGFHSSLSYRIRSHGVAGPSNTDSESRTNTALTDSDLPDGQLVRELTDIDRRAIASGARARSGWALIAVQADKSTFITACHIIAEYPNSSEIAASFCRHTSELRMRPPRRGGLIVKGYWAKLRVDLP